MIRLLILVSLFGHAYAALCGTDQYFEYRFRPIKVGPVNIDDKDHAHGRCGTGEKHCEIMVQLYGDKRCKKGVSGEQLFAPEGINIVPGEKFSPREVGWKGHSEWLLSEARSTPFSVQVCDSDGWFRGGNDQIIHAQFQDITPGCRNYRHQDADANHPWFIEYELCCRPLQQRDRNSGSFGGRSGNTGTFGGGRTGSRGTFGSGQNKGTFGSGTWNKGTLGGMSSSGTFGQGRGTEYGNSGSRGSSGDFGSGRTGVGSSSGTFGQGRGTEYGNSGSHGSSGDFGRGRTGGSSGTFGQGRTNYGSNGDFGTGRGSESGTFGQGRNNYGSSGDFGAGRGSSSGTFGSGRYESSGQSGDFGRGRGSASSGTFGSGGTGSNSGTFGSGRETGGGWSS